MEYDYSKVKHSVKLWTYEEAMLQQAYEKYDGCRRLNNFISVLTSIGLDRCLNLSNHSEFEHLFQVTRNRNANRTEGKPVQKETTGCTWKERIKELEHRAADYVTPHYDTKIIQFPQIHRFPGSA